jgi:hypothetical protein
VDGKRLPVRSPPPTLGQHTSLKDWGQERAQPS